MNNPFVEFKVVAKSTNTNSFGLHQYVMAARTGLAYKVHRTLSFQWQEKEIVRVPLRLGPVNADGSQQASPAWEALSAEMPEQIIPFPAQLLQGIWPN